MTAKAKRRQLIVRAIEMCVHFTLTCLLVLTVFALPELICRLMGYGI